MIFRSINGLVGLLVEEFRSYSSCSRRRGQWKIQFPRRKNSIRPGLFTCRAGSFRSCQKSTNYQAHFMRTKDVSTNVFRVCLGSLSFSTLCRLVFYTYFRLRWVPLLACLLCCMDSHTYDNKINTYTQGKKDEHTEYNGLYYFCFDDMNGGVA